MLTHISAILAIGSAALGDPVGVARRYSEDLKRGVLIYRHATTWAPG